MKSSRGTFRDYWFDRFLLKLLLGFEAIIDPVVPAIFQNFNSTRKLMRRACDVIFIVSK